MSSQSRHFPSSAAASVIRRGPVALFCALAFFLAGSFAGAQSIRLGGGEIDTAAPSALMSATGVPAPAPIEPSDASADAATVSPTPQPASTPQDSRYIGPSPPVAPTPASSGSGRELLLVQFKGPIQDDWLDEYRRAGFEIHHYYPDYAYLMSADRGSIGDGLRGPSARWAGGVSPRLKIAPGVGSGRTASSDADSDLQSITILSVDDLPAKLLSERGIVIQSIRRSLNGWFDTRARVPADLVTEISEIWSVFHIEQQPVYRLLGERAVQTAAGNYPPGAAAPAGPGYTDWLALNGLTGGFGRIAEVVDDGVDKGVGTNSTGHPDLQGRIAGLFNATSDPNSDSRAGHGTVNAGIIVGTAATGLQGADGYLHGQGMAPLAKIFGTKIFTNSGGFFDIGTNDFADLARNAQNAGARFSSNSWGASANGAYNSDSAEYDALVRDANDSLGGNQQMTYIFAAGNDGSSVNTIGSPATAKNVISVGAGENSDANGVDGCLTGPSEADNIRDLASFSSRGPTDDGRLGVTLVSVGTHVIGPASTVAGYDGSGVCDQYWPAGQTLYARSSGTSHSTPLVTAAAMLADELFADQLSVFGHDPTPSPAMIKAALVNTASDLAGGNDGAGGTLAPVPDIKQGWGALNFNNLLDRKDALFTLDETVVFGASFESWETTITPIDPGEPLRITLAWTDAPAAPGANPTLVNDLNLIVIGGAVYRGNVFSNGFSTTGGVPDDRNNLECVYIENPTGTYTVRVNAGNIAGNGVPGFGDGTDQDFALFVSNGTNQTSAGTVRLTEDRFTCGESASVLVSDSDLVGAGSIAVSVSSSTGDSEPLTLTETTPGSGVFLGSIDLREGAPAANGQLDVQNNATVTATYNDADTGSGSGAIVTDNATVDCVAPALESVGFDSVQTDRFKISFETDEPSTAEIRIGDSCGETLITRNSSLKSSHSVTIEGLDPCTTYFVQVLLSDDVGNSLLADNGGKCYSVRTKEFVSTFAAGFDAGGIGWSHFPLTGSDRWAVRTVTAVDGTSPAYTYEPGSTAIADAVLVSPLLEGGGELRFFHSFSIETGFDGAVLEISQDGGATWDDLGARIVEGGYTGTVSSSFGNPIGGRPAWTGGGTNPFPPMTEVVVDLSGYIGTIRVRFRFASDSSVASGGWRIDDVRTGSLQLCIGNAATGWELYE